jgi:hypothetical protein
MDFLGDKGCQREVVECCFDIQVLEQNRWFDNQGEWMERKMEDFGQVVQ